MSTNKMKALLRAGKPALGCSIMIPSPQMVEMAAHAGFDWVLIDMEHGTIGLETAELMIMAAEARGITPIVRPRNNASPEITSVMDRGAAGVQVPHINTAADARRALAAVKFGAGDNRGLAAGTRPDSYGLAKSMPDFVRDANAKASSASSLNMPRQSRTSTRSSPSTTSTSTSSAPPTSRNPWATPAIPRRHPCATRSRRHSRASSLPEKRRACPPPPTTSTRSSPAAAGIFIRTCRNCSGRVRARFLSKGRA